MPKRVVFGQSGPRLQPGQEEAAPEAEAADVVQGVEALAGVLAAVGPQPEMRS